MGGSPAGRHGRLHGELASVSGQHVRTLVHRSRFRAPLPVKSAMSSRRFQAVRRRRPDRRPRRGVPRAAPASRRGGQALRSPDRPRQSALRPGRGCVGPARALSPPARERVVLGVVVVAVLGQGRSRDQPVGTGLVERDEEPGATPEIRPSKVASTRSYLHVERDRALGRGPLGQRRAPLGAREMGAELGEGLPPSRPEPAPGRASARRSVPVGRAGPRSGGSAR